MSDYPITNQPSATLSTSSFMSDPVQSKRIGTRYTMDCNRKIACEPFPINVVEKENRHGMVLARQKGTVTPLKVLFRYQNVYALSTVYVKSEHAMSLWAKEVYDVEGIKYILVPEEAVLLVEEFA